MPAHSEKTEAVDAIVKTLDSCTPQQARVLKEILLAAKNAMDVNL